MKLENNLYVTGEDVEFDEILNPKFQRHSKVHWTPIQLINQALNWLKPNKDTKILDIGSGIGKFCLIGAMKSEGHFTGVEKRQDLHNEAILLKNKLGLNNVDFIHSDIMDVNFTDYNAFYFFNPFCEHVALSDWIDQEIDLNESDYLMYHKFVVTELNKMPIGTKVVTYYSYELDLSNHYKMVELMFEGHLQLWVRV